MQKENLFKLIAKNKKGEHLSKWTSDHEIEAFYYSKRLDAKTSQENSTYVTSAVKKENLRKENLRKTLEKYEAEELKSS